MEAGLISPLPSSSTEPASKLNMNSTFQQYFLASFRPRKQKLNNRNESIGTIESVSTGFDKNTSNVLKW